MATTTIDTHSLVKQLRGAGFSDDQAEILTGIVKAGHDADLDRFVTKEFLRAELQFLDQRLNARLAETDRRVDSLEQKMDARFESHDQRMDARFAASERRSESLEQRVTIRLGSMLVVGMGIAAALARLL